MQAHTAHKVLAGSGGPATGSYALHVNSNCAMFTNNMPAYRVPPLQPPPHPQYRSVAVGNAPRQSDGACHCLYMVNMSLSNNVLLALGASKVVCFGFPRHQLYGMRLST